MAFHSIVLYVTIFAYIFHVLRSYDQTSLKYFLLWLKKISLRLKA